VNLGGVQTGTVNLIECPRCSKPVAVPAGLVIRIPKEEVYWCHETVDPRTGVVHRKGSD
jgi:hypothetical protein